MLKYVCWDRWICIHSIEYGFCVNTLLSTENVNGKFPLFLDIKYMQSYRNVNQLMKIRTKWYNIVDESLYEHHIHGKRRENGKKKLTPIQFRTNFNKKFIFATSQHAF